MITTHLVMFSFLNGASVSSVVVAPVVSAPRRAGRRRRAFVELDGQRIEVDGYEEAERLLADLRREEKAQEKDRKKVVVLLGKARKPQESIGIYKAQEKVEFIERRMDDRAEKIASLYAMILKNMEDEISNDDEEVLLLS